MTDGMQEVFFGIKEMFGPNEYWRSSARYEKDLQPDH
jgi:hypothetical protein